MKVLRLVLWWPENIIPNIQYCLSLLFVTGSAKKGHNRTSLNLQYKALNTLGEILAYY